MHTPTKYSYESMRIICENCGVKIYIWKKTIAVIDATFAAAQRKPKKTSGLYGIQTLDLCDAGVALYQLS